MDTEQTIFGLGALDLAIYAAGLSTLIALIRIITAMHSFFRYRARKSIIHVEAQANVVFVLSDLKKTYLTLKITNLTNEAVTIERASLRSLRKSKFIPFGYKVANIALGLTATLDWTSQMPVKIGAYEVYKTQTQMTDNIDKFMTNSAIFLAVEHSRSRKSQRIHLPTAYAWKEPVFLFSEHGIGGLISPFLLWRKDKSLVKIKGPWGRKWVQTNSPDTAKEKPEED